MTLGIAKFRIEPNNRVLWIFPKLNKQKIIYLKALTLQHKGLSKENLKAVLKETQRITLNR